MLFSILIFSSAISYNEPVEPETGEVEEEVEQNSIQFTLKGITLSEVFLCCNKLWTWHILCNTWNDQWSAPILRPTKREKGFILQAITLSF